MPLLSHGYALSSWHQAPIKKGKGSNSLGVGPQRLLLCYQHRIGHYYRFRTRVLLGNGPGRRCLYYCRNSQCTRNLSEKHLMDCERQILRCTSLLVSCVAPLCALLAPRSDSYLLALARSALIRQAPGNQISQSLLPSIIFF